MLYMERHAVDILDLCYSIYIDDGYYIDHYLEYEVNKRQLRYSINNMRYQSADTVWI